MTGLASRKGPISTERSRMSIPGDVRALKDRSRDARAHVVVCADVVAHRDHAAVTTAHAAAHHPLDRDLRAPAVPGREPRDRLQHRFGTARMDRDLTASAPQLAVERDGYAATVSEAAVFGREHESDVLREPIQVKELGR